MRVPPLFAGGKEKEVADYHHGLPKEEVTEVDALAGKLDAIDFNGGPAAGMAVDEEATTWTIRVKTLTGREIDAHVASTDPVGTIKRRVEEQQGIPPAQQRLILGGKQLADNKTLRESNVEPGCVIHLVVALRGGGYNL